VHSLEREVVPSIAKYFSIDRRINDKFDRHAFDVAISRDRFARLRDIAKIQPKTPCLNPRRNQSGGQQ
jgi:hypothetical protein